MGRFSNCSHKQPECVLESPLSSCSIGEPTYEVARGWVEGWGDRLRVVFGAEAGEAGVGRDEGGEAGRLGWRVALGLVGLGRRGWKWERRVESAGGCVGEVGLVEMGLEMMVGAVWNASGSAAGEGWLVHTRYRSHLHFETARAAG